MRASAPPVGLAKWSRNVEWLMCTAQPRVATPPPTHAELLANVQREALTVAVPPLPVA